MKDFTLQPFEFLVTLPHECENSFKRRKLVFFSDRSRRYDYQQDSPEANTKDLRQCLQSLRDECQLYVSNILGGTLTFIKQVPMEGPPTACHRPHFSLSSRHWQAAC